MTARKLQSARQLVSCLLLGIIWSINFSCSAQEVAWDISPYEVHVWLALEPTPDLTLGWRTSLEREIRRVAEHDCGPAWNLHVEDAPAGMRAELINNLDSLTMERIQQVKPDVQTLDKIYLVAISVASVGYTVEIRELDTRCEYLGPVLKREVEQPNALATTVAASVMEAFSPLGVIERIRDDLVFVRMRAGMLAGHDDSPLSLSQGAVMRPVVRRYDRLGKLLPNGLEQVPWTLLQVTNRRQDGLECAILTGLASPLRARSSRRVERLVLAVKPFQQQSTLRLRSLQDAEKPLVGYEIHARLPAEKSSTFVGRSDWRGEFTLARDEHLVKILYVRSGSKLIARLPVVPGYEPIVDVVLPDDQVRLEAEGFLRGMQEEIVDIVARRTVLAVRIRMRLEENDVGEAEKLFDQLLALPTRDDLDRRLRARRQMTTTPDRRTQARIDQMFRQTQELLQKHLGSSEIDALRAELSAAQRASGS